MRKPPLYFNIRGLLQPGQKKPPISVALWSPVDRSIERLHLINGSEGGRSGRVFAIFQVAVSTADFSPSLLKNHWIISNTKTWVRSAVVWIGNGIFQSKIWKYMHKIEKRKKHMKKIKNMKKTLKDKSQKIWQNLKISPKISKNLKMSLMLFFKRGFARLGSVLHIFLDHRKSQKISKYFKISQIC